MKAGDVNAFLCPECGSTAAASSMLVSSQPQEDDPSSAVLDWITCASCESEIPAHLGERWNDITPGQAREEWLRVYRPTRCRK